MEKNYQCSWCNNYGAESWEKKVGKETYVSVEKFCCLKCKSQYETNYNIEWKKNSQDTSKVFWIFVFILILLYLLSQ